MKSVLKKGYITSDMGCMEVLFHLYFVFLPLAHEIFNVFSHLFLVEWSFLAYDIGF